MLTNAGVCQSHRYNMHQGVGKDLLAPPKLQGPHQHAAVWSNLDVRWKKEAIPAAKLGVQKARQSGRKSCVWGSE